MPARQTIRFIGKYVLAKAGILAAVCAFIIAAEVPDDRPVPQPKPATPAGTGEKTLDQPASPIKKRKPNKEEQAAPLPDKRPKPPEDDGNDEAGTSRSQHEDGEPAAKDAGDDNDQIPQKDAVKPEKPAPEPGIHEDAAALRACHAALDAFGTLYTKEQAINDSGQCGVESPVSVSEILPGVALKPANRMRCDTALALARWTKTVVKPASRALGDGVRLKGLRHGSAYVCRKRNNADHGKISEHAYGNAVDVVTFSFSGHPPLAIEPRRRTGKIEEGFQRAVVAGACLYFTTVLGPRADAAHRDNLHLDVIERRGGFRLCQ